MKTKTKVEIGTTFPYLWEGRYVNAEVVSRKKVGSRWLWTFWLTESGEPVRLKDGSIVDVFGTTRQVQELISNADYFPTLAPARQGSCVVRWINFNDPNGRQWPGDGLWCEVREWAICGRWRPTHWQRCEYGSVEALLASGDAVAAKS